jgi:hypothetical protein
MRAGESGVRKAGAIPVSSIVSRIAAIRAAASSMPSPDPLGQEVIVRIDPAARKDQRAGGKGHALRPLQHQQRGRADRDGSHQHQGGGGDRRIELVHRRFCSRAWRQGKRLGRPQKRDCTSSPAQLMSASPEGAGL